MGPPDDSGTTSQLQLVGNHSGSSGTAPGHRDPLRVAGIRSGSPGSAPESLRVVWHCSGDDFAAPATTCSSGNDPGNASGAPGRREMLQVVRKCSGVASCRHEFLNHANSQIFDFKNYLGEIKPSAHFFAFFGHPDFVTSTKTVILGQILVRFT